MVIEAIRQAATTGAVTVTRVASTTTIALAIAVTRLAVTALGLVAVLVLKRSLVPLVRLAQWHICEWAFTGHAAHFGQLTAQVGINGQVHSHVIELGQATFWRAVGHMAENAVVELMLKHAQLLIIGQASHELRIIDKLKLSRMWIDAHTGSRNGSGRTLLDGPRKSGKEGLLHEQAGGVFIKVEGHRTPVT